MTNLRSLLASKYIAQLQQHQSSEQDLSDLVNALVEFTFFNLREKKTISDRLFKLLEENIKKGNLGLSETQITFLSWGLSQRSELGFTESRIRSLLIQEVGRELQSFKLQDLVRVAVNLNRMDLFDLDNSELSTLRQIAERILKSITELEEKTVFELIRSPNVGKLPGIYRIYEEVSRNVFAEIDQQGES